MNEMSKAIAEVRTKVTPEEWQQRITECRESGQSIRAWCENNGIAASSYFHNLRKLRESVLQENRIVPLEMPRPEAARSSEIRIEAGDITVSLPEDATAEQLTAILSVLKLC